MFRLNCIPDPDDVAKEALDILTDLRPDSKDDEVLPPSKEI